MKCSNFKGHVCAFPR